MVWIMELISAYMDLLQENKLSKIIDLGWYEQEIINPHRMNKLDYRARVKTVIVYSEGEELRPGIDYQEYHSEKGSYIYFPNEDDHKPTKKQITVKYMGYAYQEDKR